MNLNAVRRPLWATVASIAAALLVALAVAPPGSAAGPAIKTQQCNVLPLPQGNFALNDLLYVANRSNVITGYQDLVEDGSGFIIGGPDRTLGGSNTQLSLVSKNYLAGMARDSFRHLYVAGTNTNTVTVYTAPLAGANNTAPIGRLTSTDRLSQPAGLALDTGLNLLYVANTGNNTVTAYQVTASESAAGFVWKATLSGLSAPVGLAINSNGTLLYVANKGGNNIAVYSVGAGPSFTALPVAPLQDLTGPIGIALNAGGTKLYVANNGKTAGWYSVTIYDVVAGVPQPAAKHIGGDQTGLCNPATVAVDPTGSYLWVASRESSGGSLTAFNLNVDGSLKAAPGGPADFNIRPAAMMLHSTVNQLGAPVGLLFDAP